MILKGRSAKRSLLLYMKSIHVRLAACLLALLTFGASFVGCTKSLSIDNTSTITSEHFSISKEQINVYRYLAGLQELSYYYEEMYLFLAYYGSAAESYIEMMDPFGTFLEYVKAGKSPAAYIHDHMAEHLPAGSFDENAYNSVTRYLAYCEGAMSEGLLDGYREAAAETVEENMKNLQSYADELDISFSRFIASYMGKGITESDIREALEIREMAALHAAHLFEIYAETATEDELKTYMSAHKEDFFTSTYRAYPLADRDMLNAVNACSSLKDAQIAILDYYINARYHRYYSMHFSGEVVVEDPTPEQTREDIRTTILAICDLTDAGEVFVDGETDSYRMAARKVVESLLGSEATAGENTETVLEAIEQLSDMEKITVQTATYVDPADENATSLDQWLFLPGRAAGDFSALLSTEVGDDQTAELTYVLYIADEILLLDQEKTCDAYCVMLTDDAVSDNGLSALGKAEKMYKELKDLRDTDTFLPRYEELINELMPGYSSEPIEMISYQKLESSAPSVAEWLYSESRKPFDMAHLRSDEQADANEDVNYYFVCFIQRNAETWLENSRDGVGYDKLETYCQDMTKQYHVKVVYDPDHTPETTESETE